MTRSIDHTARTENVTAPPEATRWLALGTSAGAVLFTFAWVVLGFFATDYTIEGSHVEVSVISQPISGLGMGATAPFMNTAFILSGVLLTAGVFGVFWTTKTVGRPVLRLICTMLLALSGLGLVLAGAFDISRQLPHLLGFMLAGGTPIVSFLVAGRYFLAIPRWRRFGAGLLIASPVTLLLMILSQTSFDTDLTAAGEGVAGLYSRALATWVLGWFAAMGWLASRKQGTWTTG